MILEIGCGTGRNLPRFMKEGDQVHAVDFDLDAVSTARTILAEEGVAGKVFFAVSRAERLPYVDSVFKEVHCIDVLHWAADAEGFESLWMEAWRVLRQGGTFFATLRTGVRDARWFYAEDALIEILTARCKGETVERSKSALALRKVR